MKREDGLYVILSEYMFKNKKFDNNYFIAKAMMSKLYEFPNVKIEEIAYLANTSSGSVTKFCKKLGFDGYSQLRYYSNERIESPISEIICSATNKEEANQQFISFAVKSLENNFNHFDQEQIKRIAIKLMNSKSIAIISGFHGFGANNLARELFNTIGISCYEIYRDSDYSLIRDILNSTDFCFIISLTGKWVDKHWMNVGLDVGKDKLALISYNQPKYQYFNECVTFEWLNNFYSTTYLSSHTIETFFISLIIEVSILSKQ